MRPLSKNERRLVLAFAALGVIFLSFWGYNALALRRATALGQQRTLRADISRLEQLQLEKANAITNRNWITSHLPAYTDVDQLETYLYKTIAARASQFDIELSKEDPRPTQKDDFVHRSIVDVEFTEEIESVISFLHSIQDQEAFRFVSQLELIAGKDPQKIRCVARVEQWWRADSESLAAATAGGTAPGAVIPSLPSTAPAPATGDGSAAASSGPSPAPPAIEQSSGETVRTAASQSVPPSTGSSRATDQP